MRGGWVDMSAEERETMVVVGWIKGWCSVFTLGWFK